MSRGRTSMEMTVRSQCRPHVGAKSKHGGAPASRQTVGGPTRQTPWELARLQGCAHLRGCKERSASQNRTRDDSGFSAWTASSSFRGAVSWWRGLPASRSGSWPGHSF